VGPCDNSEDSLAMGIVGEGGCSLDCYFDSNIGQGDDNCRWDLRCDALMPVSSCPFNPSLVGSSSCPNNQSGSCNMACGDLTPNGCDCFGCCPLPGMKEGVFIGALDINGNGRCTAQVLGDPARCPPCTVNTACLNSCDSCEVCVGRPLPGSCSQQVCPAGHARCGEPGQAACGGGFACITGCCMPTP
jgi:hypothetical protein